MPAPHLVIVPHTHWDREWYRTHEEFRVRLVALVDSVLDLLERDPEFRHFMLDGQTIVLEDYLAVRPAARGRIEKLVREGRLAVGPWHVLPDEWLVSGEALVRNLRAGMARAAGFGGAMPLGYVPDQFGHVGQLPQIFRRFGLDGAVLWRGVGDDVRESGFWWEAPDGSRVFTLYLPTGYGNAALLPLEPRPLAKRLRRVIAELAPFTRGTTHCLMNGSDHQTPQAGLPALLPEAVAALDAGATFEIGTLVRAHARIRDEQSGAAPVHRGELRSGLRAPLLPGCASARLWQKQREFANDRLLVRVLEPLAALAGSLGAPVDRGLLDFTWSVALENHPHDSICGCSVDAVHAQMEPRFDRVADLARAQLEGVCDAISARLSLPERGPGAGDAFAVWNANGAAVERVDTTLELDVPGLDPAALRPGQRLALHVRSADGARTPADVRVEEPGLAWRTPFSLPLARIMAPDLPREMMGFHANSASFVREGDVLRVRVVMGSAPRGDFDLEAARRALVEALADPALTGVAVDVTRPAKLRLSFEDSLPGHGLRVYRIGRGRASAPASPAERAPTSGALPGGGGFLENAHWRIEASGDGRVRIARRADGATIEDALRVVSEGDRGDTYNFDPVPGEAALSEVSAAKVRVERAGASEAVMDVVLRLRVPESLATGRAARSARRVALPVTLRIRLSRRTDRIEVEVSGTNTARDHRLRLHVQAPFEATRFEAESAFETAVRPIAPRRADFGSEHPAEFPIGAVPMRSFATIDDGTRALTVAGRGSPEVEAVPAAGRGTALAITLLRAVGWLSGADLALRPGPAGPLFPTPGAQVPGPFRAELALRLHAAGDDARVTHAHAFAWRPFAFATGDGAAPGAAGSRPLRDGARIVEIDDPAVIVSAVEPGPEGMLRLRLYEATGRARSVRGRFPGASSIRAVDFTGAPDPALGLRAEGERFALELRGGGIADLEVERG